MNSVDEDSEWRSFHRVVLPTADALDGTAGLYVRTIGDHAVLDRHALRLDAGARASFGTYFGAVPMMTWVAGTSMSRVRLSAQVDGEARVRVFGTDAVGGVHELMTDEAAGGWTAELSLDSRSTGWLWFEVEADRGVAVVRDAHWSAPVPTPWVEATASVAITTFDRRDDCIALLRRLAADAEVASRIVQVLVADQGTRHVHAHPDFPEAAALWGDKLRVVEQDNLGGSGGFSRGMIEALETTASHVLLLDDDVVLEPESVLRLLSLADHAEDEPLVGAHMLRLTEPTRLHSWGEHVDLHRFWWEPVTPALSGLDVAVASPDRTPSMSAPYAVDFNGWWMCLIPLSAVRRVGASLPLFIKWDDAEYGLRAAEAGHKTVTLPGAALWHVPWTVKDDGLDWQAYFQLRNRLVAALIHSPSRRAGRLLREMFALDVNHILCMQYGSAAVRQLAAKDVLAGPEHLVPTLRTGPSRIRAVLDAEGQDLRPLGADWRVLRSGAPAAPHGKAARLGRVLRVVFHQLRRDASALESDQDDLDAVLRREDGKWWSLGVSERVFLRSATGTDGFLLQRSRRRTVRLLAGALRSFFALWWHWPKLSGDYRAATAGLADPETWKSIFTGP